MSRDGSAAGTGPAPPPAPAAAVPRSGVSDSAPPPPLDEDAAAAADASASAAAAVDAELPFLVTHWLAHYGDRGGGHGGGGGDDGAVTEDVVRRIRHAASELAGAFSELGAFGAAMRSPLGRQAPLTAAAGTRSATYSDLTRRHPDVPPDRLSAVALSSASASAAAQALADGRSRPRSAVEAAYDGFGGGPSPGGGRRVGEAAPAEGGGAAGAAEAPPSILRPPAVLAPMEAPPPPPPASGEGGMTTAADIAAAAGLAADEARDAAAAAGTATAPPRPPQQRLVALALGSDHGRAGAAAAAAHREYARLRSRLRSEEGEIRSVRRTIASHSRTRDALARRRALAGAVIGSTGAAAAAAAAEVSRLASSPGGGTAMDLRSREGDAERVVARLSRTLEGLLVAQARTEAELGRAAAMAESLRARWAVARRGFGDPWSPSRPLCGTLPASFAAGSLLSSVVSRQYGAGESWRPGGTVPGPVALSRCRRSLLSRRLSHAVTINCHLFYPVYCLRFDRTGRYFVTGADDNLVKLFHLGAGVSARGSVEAGGRPGFNYGANRRGAVLVCTLRGHAGVITDIDVSVDNAMLATASEDGDVRVWGMRDGCPIAILRGHAGGANMVSWSTLTPCRIVTSGQDGMARRWDVRGAALKRYGSVVGGRSDYVLSGEGGDCASSDGEVDGEEDAGDEGEEDVALPPLPVRGQEAGGDDAVAAAAAAAAAAGGDDGGGIFVPPLPPGAEGLPLVPPGADGDADGVVGVVGVIANGAQIGAPGAFVPGDSVDEGVCLLAKLQHGDAPPSQQAQGPSTRSQRRAVNVICVTRCPAGGHFATGSDDGLGRVWADDDDGRIVLLDEEAREESSTMGRESIIRSVSDAVLQERGGKGGGKRKSGRLLSQRSGGGGDVVPSKSTLLATLAGHLNSITDIHYSHAGDRILTASQKDGVVRIWSWGNESAPAGGPLSEHGGGSRGAEGGGTTGGAGGGRVKFDGIKQILIRLTPPAGPAGGPSVTSHAAVPAGGRRRGASPGEAPTQVSCDVAAWTSDDAKVVTSQTCPSRGRGGPDIVPGSQVMYLWDSRTGQCLLGIPGAHSAPCPVLVSHPLEPTIVASAGGDGVLNVWDLDAGRSLFRHTNTLTHGHIDPPSIRGKACGYLDGTFSPDGLSLVLTDDQGRVTIIDTLVSAKGARESEAEAVASGPAAFAEGTFSDPIPLLSDDQAAPDAPDWMKEQYFANDYYDLFFDANGYCIERGSEQPPHLAPRAARCSHTGTSHPDLINEAFGGMAGPWPLPERDVRWERDAVRSRSASVRCVGGLLALNVQGKRNAINVHSVGSECCLSMSKPSAITDLLERIGASSLPPSSQVGSTPPPTRRSENNAGGWSHHDGLTSSSSSGRALSNRYRWIGYDEVMREEADDDDNDIDDEEYQDTPVRRSGRRSGQEIQPSDDEDENLSDVVDESEEEEQLGNAVEERSIGRASRRSQSSQRASAAASRQQGRRNRERRGASSRSRRRDRRGRDRERTVEFEEGQRHQPSRVSARQLTRSPSRRQRYDDPDSSDDDLVEFMSTNTAPKGDWLDDCNILGHIYRLPEGGVVHRKWLARTESWSGMTGKKTYCPQVGDSVVYIPRAHYDTIRSFPIGDNSSAPWKSWPTNSAWPVVRCEVRDVRYRFPYQSYYRNRGSGDNCLSVVAILKLEITGTPLISTDTRFPWPTEFNSRICRSASLTFEVSCFENGYGEFVVPEHLYLWRLRELESAINACNGDPVGLKVVAYFTPTEGQEGYNTEDAELIPYPCAVSGIQPEEEDEFHFTNCGFNSILVEWEANGDVDKISAWELTILGKINSVPPPPTLHEEEKAALLKIMDELEDDRQIRMWFSYPVNIRRYSDYFNMIEVPMDIRMIRKRLEGDYYTNRLSVLADVKLIRDNCIKYNDPGVEITDRSCELYETFKELLGKIPDYPGQQDHSEVQGSEVAGTASVEDPTPMQESPPRRSSRLTRRSDATMEEPSPQGQLQAHSGRSSRRPGGAGNSAQPSALENLPTQPEQSSNDSRRIRLSVGRMASAPAPEIARRTRSSVARNGLQNGKHAGNDGDDSDQKEEAYHTSSDEDDSDKGDESEESSRHLPQKGAGRKTRQASRRQAVSSPEEKKRATRGRSTHNSSDSEQEEKKQESQVCTRSARSRFRQQDYSESSDDEASREQEPRPSRSSRGKKRTKSIERSDNSDDEAEEHQPRQRRAAAGRTSSRGTYQEVGSSDFDEDTEGSDENSADSDLDSADGDDGMSICSEEFTPTPKRGGRGSIKKRKAAPEKRAAKSKRAKTSAMGTKSGDLFYPDLPRWPSVPLEKITKISKRILAILTQADRKKMFARPVAEQYPDLADSYLGVIVEPMDFRTIREERVQAYKEIADLQDDLILTFRNCCSYNGEGHEYYFYAVEMWKDLNEIFKEVCKEEDILLPRRFG